MKSPVYPEIEMKKKIITRNGVSIEIEYCPKSGGVWLDRGELEKIIKAVEEESMSYSDDMAPDISSSYNKRDDRYYDNDNRYKKKKKESILGEIFDIF